MEVYNRSAYQLGVCLQLVPLSRLCKGQVEDQLKDLNCRRLDHSVRAEFRSCVGVHQPLFLALFLRLTVDSAHIVQQEALNLNPCIVQNKREPLRSDTMGRMFGSYLVVVGESEQLTVGLAMLVVLEDPLIDVE